MPYQETQSIHHVVINDLQLRVLCGESETFSFVFFGADDSMGSRFLLGCSLSSRDLKYICWLTPTQACGFVQIWLGGKHRDGKIYHPRRPRSLQPREQGKSVRITLADSFLRGNKNVLSSIVNRKWY